MHAVALLSEPGARLGITQPVPGAAVARVQPWGQQGTFRRWPQGQMPWQRLIPKSLRSPLASAQPCAGDAEGLARLGGCSSPSSNSVSCSRITPGRAGDTGAPPARRGGTRSLGRACAGATPGDIRELKISRFSCNRLALAPAAPAARGGGGLGAGIPPLQGTGRERGWDGASGSSTGWMLAGPPRCKRGDLG